MHMRVSMGQQLSNLHNNACPSDKTGNSTVKFDGVSAPYLLHTTSTSRSEQQKQKEHLLWNKEWNSVTIIASRLVSLSQSVYGIE